MSLHRQGQVFRCLHPADVQYVWEGYRMQVVRMTSTDATKLYNNFMSIMVPLLCFVFDLRKFNPLTTRPRKQTWTNLFIPYSLGPVTTINYLFFFFFQQTPWKTIQKVKPNAHS